MTRLLSLLALLALLVAAPAHADEAQAPWTSSDVVQAISDASAATGVPAGLLTDLVTCEDRTLDPYAVGALGELGPVQIYPQGNEWPRFFAAGFTDPFNPYEAETFLGQEIALGRGPAWSCWGRV